MTGDVRAMQFLRVQVPDRVSELLQVVDGEYDSLDGALAKAAPLVDLLEARDTTQVLAGFARELGQGDRAVDGPAATLNALALARVETLLQPGRVAGSAWFGPLLARTTHLTPGRCKRWASTGRSGVPGRRRPARPQPPAPPYVCWPTSSPVGAGLLAGSERCYGTPDSPATAEYAPAYHAAGCR